MTNTLTREQIKHKLDQNEAITQIEALPPKYYNSEHLPGALNIPHDQIRDKAPDMLPNKNALIVAYCSNTTCRNSTIAVSALEQMGYTNIFKYAEGKQDWLEANLPIESNQTDAINKPGGKLVA